MNDAFLPDELEQLAAQQIGLRIPDNAHDRFIRILEEHATQLGYSSLQDYRTFLASRSAIEEWEKLARAFTSGETFFFRDHGQFDLLHLRLLPELIAQHRHDKTLRLWSAGCASGEEAYSLAMLVDMLLPERSGWDILILGTDIDSAAIARAQRGRYGKWSFRMVPPEIQQRYFNSEFGIRSAEFSTPQSEIHNPHLFVLDERIRRMVTFRVSNLVGEPFPDAGSELHDMDMILCRNVFIYFDHAAVFAVATKFAATLREGGYLLTAHTELIGHAVRGLESRMFAEGAVYQRRAQIPVPTPAIHGVQMRDPFSPTFSQAPEGMHASALSLSKEGGGKPLLPVTPGRATPPAPVSHVPGKEDMLKEARELADRGEFDLAEQACRQALAVDSLAAAPYFLLAQLAQVKGNLELAKECLNKAIYIDHHFVAAYLELAAICERAEDISRAQTLRRAALGIVRAMPSNEMIEQYETTAGELVQWLVQRESEATEGHPDKSKS